MSTPSSGKMMYGWKSIPWDKIQRNVFKLQKRIYRAEMQGDSKKVRKLQKLLTKSWSARMLATKRVSQDNQGKNTAGIDGVKSLDDKGKLDLSEIIRKPGSKCPPVRRVWIPKPGSKEKRALGIPTMETRARQALIVSALEPQWEARFEPNSYGFRPGRSCHDALEGIFSNIRSKAKYCLDADIAKCFDQIDHQALLQKLDTYPEMVPFWQTVCMK